MNTSALTFSRRILAGSIALCLAAGAAHAASGTWNGTASDGLWATQGNWSAVPVPGLGEVATFNNSGNGSTIITVGNISLLSILFDTNTVSSYTLGTGNISLGAGGNVTVNAAVNNGQTINTPLALNGAYSFINNSVTPNQNLIFGGAITSATAGGKNFVVSGAGNTIFNGNVTNGSGALGLSKTGTGMLTFAGPSNIVSNLFDVGNGTAGGTVRVASGASIATGAGTRLLLGILAAGNATFTMDAGAGTVTFGGSPFNAANYVGVDGGTAVLNANGGTLNFNGMANGAGHLHIGANANVSTGTVNINGGIINVGTRTTIGIGYPGDLINTVGNNANGSGTINLNSGALNIGTGTIADTDRGFLYLKSPAGGTGTATVNLNGGSLSLVKFAIGAGGTSKVINFNGSVVQARASRADFLATGATLNVQNGGVIFDTNGFDVTIGGDLLNNGSGGVTKNGLGTLTLAGNNTYVGNTVINAGGLVASGAYAGGLTMGANTRLVPGLNTVSSLTVPALTLGAGTVVDFDFNPGSSSDTLFVTGAGGLSLGAASFNLYNAGGLTGLSANGTYTLFDYTTSFVGSLAGLSVLNPVAGKTYSVANDAGATAITLTVGDSLATEWSGGAANGLWGTAGNWTGGSPNAVGLVAKFGAVPLTPTNVAVNGAKTVGGMLFDNSNAFTITGTPTDTITLDNGLSGGAIGVVSGNHTINAPIALIKGASVSAADGSSLTVGGVISGSGRALAFSGGTTGTLTLLADNTYSGGTTIAGGVLQLGNGGTTGSIVGGIVNNGTLILNRSDDLTFSQNISGSGRFVKMGGNTVTLSGTNSYAGGTTVNGGTLIVGGDANLGSGTSTIALNGATLRTTGNAVTARAMDIGVGGGTLVVDAGASFVTSNLNGTAPVIKNGAGTWTIGGGTIGPAFTVNGGLVDMGGSATFLANTAIVINAGATYRFTRNDMFGNHAAPTPTQTFTVNGGTLSNVNVFNAVNLVTLNGGTITANGGASAAFPSFSFKGTVAVTGTAPSTINATALANSRILVGNNVAGSQTTFDVTDATSSTATDLTISAGLQDNQSPAFVAVPTGIIKTGAGKLLLSGPNNYTGTTTVNGGLVELTGTMANNTVSSIVINDTGTFSFAKNDTWGNHAADVLTSITINAGGALKNSGNFFNALGPVTLNGGSIQSVGGAAADYPSYGFTKTVTVGGSVPSTISGTGTNSQMGVGNTNAGSQTTFTVADATGSAASDLIVSVALQNYRSPVGAVIATGLLKAGDGTMQLSGVDTYTGPTTVNAGTLLVTGSITGSAVTVSGGTLGGTGTVGATSIGLSGILAPGLGGVGTLTVSTGLTLAGTSAFEIQKTGATLSADLANVTGPLTLGGVLSVTALGDALANGDSFNLFDSPGFTGSFGSVNLPALGPGLSWNTNQLSTDGIIAVVPEPSSAICLLGGLALLAGRRRRN